LAGGLKIQLPLESRRKLTTECDAHEKGASGALFLNQSLVLPFRKERILGKNLCFPLKIEPSA
jgi:hypothetical protein